MANISNTNNDNSKVISGSDKEGQVKSWLSYSYFKYGYRNGREVNFCIGQFSLRIAQHQFAFWVKNDPVFNLLF